MGIVVSVQSIGSRKPALADFGVDPPRASPDGEDLKLRQLIEHVVRGQVAAFEARQEASRIDRVLSAAQIRDGAFRGKVDPAAKPNAQRVDADEAVANAIVSFEDGLYLVIVDGAEHRDLDGVVRVTPESKVTFLRLTFVSGI